MPEGVTVSCPHPAASPLHRCDEKPEDWCRDAVTAARCGALQLCQLTAWNQGLRVTVLERGMEGRAHPAPKCGAGAGESSAWLPPGWVSREASADVLKEQHVNQQRCPTRGVHSHRTGILQVAKMSGYPKIFPRAPQWGVSGVEGWDWWEEAEGLGAVATS